MRGNSAHTAQIPAGPPSSLSCLAWLLQLPRMVASFPAWLLQLPRMVASVASHGWLSCLAWLRELPRMVGLGGRAQQ
jgi:hypothetical protein